MAAQSDQLAGNAPAGASMTAEAFYEMPADGMRHELVRGEVRTMPPAGEGHGRITSNVSFLFQRYIREHHLGATYAAETGFALTPDTVLAPDFAFIRADRAGSARVERGFSAVMPDLVLEVVSPGDTAAEVQDKASLWLEAGVRMVCVVYPSRRQVVVYRSLRDVRVLTATDSLDGGDVLPGFTCPVADLFG